MLTTLDKSPVQGLTYPEGTHVLATQKGSSPELNLGPSCSEVTELTNSVKNNPWKYPSLSQVQFYTPNIKRVLYRAVMRSNEFQYHIPPILSLCLSECALLYVYAHLCMCVFVVWPDRQTCLIMSVFKVKFKIKFQCTFPVWTVTCMCV